MSSCFSREHCTFSFLVIACVAHRRGYSLNNAMLIDKLPRRSDEADEPAKGKKSGATKKASTEKKAAASSAAAADKDKKGKCMIL